MQRITYTNERGDRIVIGNTKPYLLQLITGTGSADIDVQLQKSPFQDGHTHIDSLLEMRSLSIHLAIMDSKQEGLYERREKISSVFNPKLEGILVYENDFTTKELSVFVDRGPTFPKREGANVQECMISLLAPSPFWLDETIEGEEMSDIIGGLSFLLEIDEEGVEFETDGNNRAIITNQGDVPTPVSIIFQGPANKPRIDNESTGQFIEVNQELFEGDELIINTEFGRKKVEINGESAWNAINIESEFWNLEVGENDISYTAETGIGTARCLVQWRNRFVGV